MIIGFDVTAEIERKDINMKCDACKITTCGLLEFGDGSKRGERVVELSAGKFMCMLWRSIIYSFLAAKYARKYIWNTHGHRNGGTIVMS